MLKRENKILIIDEYGFSRICSAIVEDCVGYETDTLSRVSDLSSKIENRNLRLIVTSYPFGESSWAAIRKRDIPAIILTDNIDKNLLAMLDGYDKAYCMIKPLDYEKFKSLVRQVVCGETVARAACGIV
jgi:hypothetical protein